MLASCSGGAGALLPSGPGAEPSGIKTAAKHRIAARVRVRIPRRKRTARPGEHPSTISALTQSVSIAVNGGTAQVFNATPTSPNCAIGATGTVCTFTVQAALGSDSFAVTTYTGTNGTGTPLDRGVATVAIAVGTANTIAVSLGPVVSTTADTGEGSLRYAVGSANVGDTIVFLTAAGSTITLASPITLSRAVTLAGPGAANLTISGGGAHQIFLVTGTATISGLTLTRGDAVTADQPGGAISNTGTLTLVDDTIGNSTSAVSVKRARALRAQRHIKNERRHPRCSDTYVEGGALYNDGALTTSGTTFTSNVVVSTSASCIYAQGGAIFNDVDGSISSTGDTFSNNAAAEGGAVYNAGLGSATFANDTFSGNTGCTQTTGCPTSGCTPMACTSFATGEGGAIYDDGSGVDISGSTFTNNTVGGPTDASIGFGGALFLASGSPSVTGSTFTGNVAGGGTSVCAEGEGGAIAAVVSPVLNDDTFSQNVAEGDEIGSGGAIATGSSVAGTNDTFASNQAISTGSACQNNGTAEGGAVFAQTMATFDSSTFDANSATANAAGGGGAVASATAVVSNDTFTSNTATATGAGTATEANAVGGAVYASTLAKVAKSTFTSNSATIAGPDAVVAAGGAVGSEGELSSTGDTYSSNTASDTAGTGQVAGGAVLGSSGQTAVAGDTYTSNSISGGSKANGGAIYVSGTFSLTNSAISGSSATAPTAAGGGLFAMEPGDIDGATFTSNAANGSTVGAGGAFYDAGGSELHDSTLTGNSATTAGGGVCAVLGSETIEGSTISSNTVSDAAASLTGGGGIYASVPIVVITSTIAKNSVTVSGAGSSGGGGIFNQDGLILSQSTISGNAVLGTAPSSGGGGIYSNAASTITDSTITGNSSSVDGGGIKYAANDSASLFNDTLYQNVAAGLGSNIDNLYTLTLTNSIVAHGTAATGTDINNAGTITSGDYNIVQSLTGTAISGTTTHDQSGDPKLLALADNGGPTFTNADQAASPGTNAIPYVAGKCGGESLVNDQRGYTLDGMKCDIGAFAYNGVVTAIRHHHARPHAIRKTGHGSPLLPNLRPAVFPKIGP